MTTTPGPAASEGGREPGRPGCDPSRRARRRAQPEVHLRPVRDRPGQPLRPRRRAGRRRAAGAGLQPALRLRAAGCRQDPPAPLDRELRPVARRRADRPLRHGRDVHERVRRRAAPGRHRAFQGALPPGRRAPHRRHPVPRTEGEDRGGVLPHLQRAPGHRQPTRPDLGPGAAGPRRRPRPSARAFRGGPRHRHRAPRPSDADDGAAQARRPRPHRAARPDGPRPHRGPRDDERPCARGGPHPRRRLRVAHRPGPRLGRRR